MDVLLLARNSVLHPYLKSPMPVIPRTWKKQKTQSDHKMSPAVPATISTKYNIVCGPLISMNYFFFLPPCHFCLLLYWLQVWNISMTLYITNMPTYFTQVPV
jgi:hypothetical protein